MRTTTPIAALAALAVTLTACGDNDNATGSSASSPSVPTTTAAATTTDLPEMPPTTVTSSTEPIGPPSTPGTVESTVATTVPAGDLAADIEAVLADALAPGAIGWTANGVEVPPTAIVAAVRIPGRDDVLVAVGENVDGSPAEADAPFSVATLTTSLVRTVALQLVDEGVLDPTATVDEWVPTLPNADRVTVQMLFEYATGWGESPLPTDPVLSDLERAWTLREVVELRATTVTALADPGTSSTAGLFIDTLLGLIVEEVTGRSLAELVHDRVAVPAGLDDTALGDAEDAIPERFRHGRLNINGAAVDTSAVAPVAYITYYQATSSVASTPTDLLDLLDAWHSGQFFVTDRTAAPDRFIPDPAGNPNTRVGVNVPFNGYCPCTEADDEMEVSAIGRTPANAFSRNVLLRYADGISVVLNVNTGVATDGAELGAVVDELHDIAIAAS